MQHKLLKTLLASAISLAINPAIADTYIRTSQLGYTPDREKVVVVMSDKSLLQADYQVTKNGQVIFSKKISSANITKSDYSPFISNHKIDLSELNEIGEYSLKINLADGETAVTDFKIASDIYAGELTQLLTHLKTTRSGTTDTLNHGVSHLNDAQANVTIANGKGIAGADSTKWKNLDASFSVDVAGGWYDAGDYIKFSLTNAVTAYYLTRAYEANPAIHKKVLSNSNYVDILDEAKHGLDYLLKLMPTDDLFINQVGSHKDHDQADRLPENDTLSGFDRPAFAAKYAPNMLLVAAALAHGATVFNPFDEALSERYLSKAKQIWKAAQTSDILDYLPYDREWFYPDSSLDDNMVLASTELYKATGELPYLSIAKTVNLKAQYSASWESYSLSANQRLSQYDNNASLQFGYEIDSYDSFSKNTNGNVWGLPSTIYWASLYNNLLIAAVAAEQANAGDERYLQLAYDNLDYLYGKNNWGTSFVVSDNVTQSADKIYHQMYRLSGKTPVGAVSEGPVERTSLLEAFADGAIAQPYKSEMQLMLDNSAFDTQAYIFVDHDRNYSNQETTIFGQAAAIYLLSSVSALQTESVVTPTPTVTPTPPVQNVATYISDAGADISAHTQNFTGVVITLDGSNSSYKAAQSNNFVPVPEAINKQWVPLTVNAPAVFDANKLVATVTLPAWYSLGSCFPTTPPVLEEPRKFEYQLMVGGSVDSMVITQHQFPMPASCPTPPPPPPTPTAVPTLPPSNDFIPGTTTVNNGDEVTYAGSCFVAKNNPGSWETPKANSWFWDEVDCAGTGVTITPTPNITVTPVITPTVVITPTIAITPTPIITPTVAITPTLTITPTPIITPTPTIGDTTWSVTQVYNSGDEAVLNGVTYRAAWWTKGQDPEKSGDWGVWKKI